jgi:endonuclease YncB( thermonuclease family)
MKALLLASVLIAYVSSDDHVVPAEVVSVYDGDTINVRAEIWPDIYWEGAIRLNNIDTPEIGWRAECPQEAALAYEAKALMEEYARGRVLIVNPKLGKFAGRVIADIMTLEGIFLDDMLIGAGLAREYHGGRREGWCPE